MPDRLEPSPTVASSLILMVHIFSRSCTFIADLARPTALGMKWIYWMASGAQYKSASLIQGFARPNSI